MAYGMIWEIFIKTKSDSLVIFKAKSQLISKYKIIDSSKLWLGNVRDSSKLTAPSPNGKSWVNYLPIKDFVLRINHKLDLKISDGYIMMYVN